MIAKDVVDEIGRLAEEMGSAQVDEILLRIGVAPDELDRMMMVALWSLERVAKSLATQEEYHRDDRIDGAAAWLDGFRDRPPRSPRGDGAQPIVDIALLS